ncbi:MAG: hypothetical protein ABSC41_10320 [Acidimicrobiales bacterium]|jgi:hypothetical protein
MSDPIDEPPPPPSRDVNCRSRPEGGEVWLSERIELRPALVQGCIEWLENQPGVDRVIYEGADVLLVDGRFDEALQSELNAWWTERIADDLS